MARPCLGVMNQIGSMSRLNDMNIRSAIANCTIIFNMTPSKLTMRMKDPVPEKSQKSNKSNFSDLSARETQRNEESQLDMHIVNDTM